MEVNCTKYQQYTKILNDELVPAMGCTEPIAIAYCASIARYVLKNIPTKLEIIVSNNIVKNVKSVTVPNTNGMHGIEAAAGIGILAGDCFKKLEVISNATDKQISFLPEYLKTTDIKVKSATNSHALYIEIVAYFNKGVAKVIIEDSHTHVILVSLNDDILYEDLSKIQKIVKNDYSCLNIKEIIEYANIVKIEDVNSSLDRQIEYNMAIAREGIKNDYGANIGKTLLKYDKNNILSYVKGLAAAASDARMNGCDLPVIINSGSGNQGITCSVPVIAYATKTNKTKEELYRALVVSNLCTTHIKENIGTLSAYCGVVIAGACAGAGIAYLENNNYELISNTIINALAMASGIVCDGAKPSCAGKISLAVESGMLGYYMARDNNNFYNGDGIVKDGVEDTIRAVGLLARDGMKETDKEIIHIMIDEC